jgi:hypothetical protein
MALLFSAVLFLLSWMGRKFGEQGLLGSAVLVGTTDLDALVYSVGRLAAANQVSAIAVQALLTGLLSNTVFKLAAAMLLGRGGLRRVVGPGLAAFAVTFVVGLFLIETRGTEALVPAGASAFGGNVFEKWVEASDAGMGPLNQAPGAYSWIENCSRVGGLGALSPGPNALYRDLPVTRGKKRAWIASSTASGSMSSSSGASPAG